ncbi:MAG: hypothetical protein KDJ52_20350 [Anaerolineae bacterium]|nr:hypothetical protein [Anaerolineae bacterium]
MKFIINILEKIWQSDVLVGMAACTFVPCCEFWLETGYNADEAEAKNIPSHIEHLFIF